MGDPVSICGFAVIEAGLVGSLLASWPRFQRPPFAFSVASPNHAVAVLVGTGVYHLLLETDGRRTTRSLAVVRD